MEQWRPPTEFPGDGESIWIHVLEHDGTNTHTDYAQTFIDVDGLLIHRYEGERGEYGEPWPPKDVIAWMPCDVPECKIQTGYFGNEDGRWDDYPYANH